MMRRLFWLLVAAAGGALAVALERADRDALRQRVAESLLAEEDGPDPEAEAVAGNREAGDAGEEEVRCAARTGSGSRCRRRAEPGSDRCWQHA